MIHYVAKGTFSFSCYREIQCFNYFLYNVTQENVSVFSEGKVRVCMALPFSLCIRCSERGGAGVRPLLFFFVILRCNIVFSVLSNLSALMPRRCLGAA